jgi:serine/threonine protein kinase
MMSHCGKDLNKEWEKFMCNRRTAKSPDLKLLICDMACQILNALKVLHECGFCHWDLKLDNICYKDGYYFLIDFALAQRVHNPYSHRRKTGCFKGNTMFASIHKYEMLTPAFPIDDIEALLYLVCFCFDEFYLPWLQDYLNQQNTQ